MRAVIDWLKWNWPLVVIFIFIVIMVYTAWYYSS